MSEYRRLSTAAKQRYHLDRMREPPMRCPGCGTSVQPDELLAHQAERCTGQQEPHPQSRWLTWGEAVALGAPDGTLRRWARQGRVRTQGRAWRRKYLHRDLVALLAARNAKTAKSGG